MWVVGGGVRWEVVWWWFGVAVGRSVVGGGVLGCGVWGVGVGGGAMAVCSGLGLDFGMMPHASQQLYANLHMPCGVLPLAPC